MRSVGVTAGMHVLVTANRVEANVSVSDYRFSVWI